MDLAWHKKRAEAHQSGHELEDAQFTSRADHTAAAADRLPWPTYRHLECAFDGGKNHFKHPLGKAILPIQPFRTADQATDHAWKSRPGLEHVTGGADFDRAQFFAYWRLWRWWASDREEPKDSRMAFLPADTRIPDHTIWSHNSLVSAFQACVEPDGQCRPAFLMFSIGPVQDFIAQARRTLDLWSGSYLLSYLTGSALRHIALTLGPDQIIFPNLCGQPIMDLLLKEEIWDKAFTGKVDESKPLWDSFEYDTPDSRRRLLTPSLPNRFLALVPAGRAQEIAGEVKAAVEKTFEDIAKKVWELAGRKLDPLHPIAGQEARFFGQVNRHLDISYQTLDWPSLPEQAKEMMGDLLPSEKADPAAGLQAIIDFAAKMPKEHRDVRNFQCDTFKDGPKKGWKDKSKLAEDAKLDNPGAAWSALYSLLNWQLDAVRQTRAWKAWSQDHSGPALLNEKDSLSGKEEGVLNLAGSGVTKEQVKELGKAIASEHLFKKGEILGAVTLIKRLWPTAWLMKEHDFTAGDFKLPDTRNIAEGKPFEESGDDDEAPEGKNGSSYFAVLAFDGDEMGKWVSGNHPDMPKLRDLLAGYEEGGVSKGAVTYFKDNPALSHLLDQPRPLNPSFHLQFSEMLGTFSNVCARRIVEAFDGRLIYSGGDDVLALLPSGQALACAQALRAAFRGTEDLNKVCGIWDVDQQKRHSEKRADFPLFDVKHEGFVQLHADNYAAREGEPKNFPAIVPGPATDCSVGIAIAHFKSPLQDAVRAAQAAEKRAKGKLGRAAVAVSLFKRSGEILEWGCQWSSGGLALYEAMTKAMALKPDGLSGKFPHRVCQLLEPYLTATTGLSRQQEATGFTASDVITREFSHAAERQGSKDIAQDLALPLQNYLKGIHDARTVSEAKNLPIGSSLNQEQLTSLIGLCRTVAFAHRTAQESTSPAEKQSNP